MREAEDTTVTAPQRHARERAWRGWLIAALMLIVALFGLVPITLGVFVLLRYSGASTPYYPDPLEHFKYGSIGAETASGLPRLLWQALPELYPEVFRGRADYAAFGFLYESDKGGEPRTLPIGISSREARGIELVWFNCAVCHTGRIVLPDADGPTIIPGMPSNQLDLHGFVSFVLGLADDPQLTPDRVLPAIEASGGDLDLMDRLAWRYVILPTVREQLIERAARLKPLLDLQPAWGRGRVDTFNPYKVLQFGWAVEDLAPDERIGASDFPSIFLQGPRDGMQLHWDGNNRSLQERNLSAAIGAGVTPETVDLDNIARVASWLLDLSPPSAPARGGTDEIEAGRHTYMRACASCHGYRTEQGYVFEGEHLGTVVPAAVVGADPARLDSYTAEFAETQRTLFAGTPYQFSHFQKTDGYAAQPLDGLWLRAPYLHNGSVPTLSDLLAPPDRRPARFLRGAGVIDLERGGIVATACDAEVPPPPGTSCYDTSLPGNGNQGHLWGTDLAPEDKASLLAYLLTF